MPVNEQLAIRIRAALSGIADVEEKKMLRGISFMVNGKMCISLGENAMFRIDPALHDEALQHKGASTMIMKGREYKGYVNVTADGLTEDFDFNYWVGLAVAFNDRAIASPKKKKK